MTDATHLRAVFDTNVVLAALLSRNPLSPTVELMKRWRNGEFALLYADDLLLEYREKFIARQIEQISQIAFLAQLHSVGERVQLRRDEIGRVVTADPDDDIVIACAVVGKAPHLVTYDPHLLNLGKTYQGVAILDGLHFLYTVRGDTAPDPEP